MWGGLLQVKLLTQRPSCRPGKITNSLISNTLCSLKKDTMDHGEIKNTLKIGQRVELMETGDLY